MIESMTGRTDNKSGLKIRHRRAPSLEQPANVVHVVDDDQHVRTGMRLLLKSAGFAVETYYSGSHFLCMYRPRDVECVLLDLQMPGPSGLELQEEMRKRRIQTPQIVVSAFADTPSVVQAMRNGALDFLEKPIEEVVLIDKVNDALACDRRAKERNGELARRLARLSAREREVMDLLIEAKTTLEIARQLDISPKTVEKHRVRIFEKTHTASVPELMRVLLWETREG